MSDFECFVMDFDELVGRQTVGCARYAELFYVLGMCRRLLGYGSKVLEYGAWPGLHSIYINKKFGSEVWAIDNWQYPERLGYDVDDWILCFAGLEKIHSQFGDICKTVFENKFFDVVFSLGVHEHIEDDLGALVEINRILKDDGVVCMTVDFHPYGWDYWEYSEGRCYDPVSLNRLIYNSPFKFANGQDYSQLNYNQANCPRHPNPSAWPVMLVKR